MNAEIPKYLSLADFDHDGRKVLRYLVERSHWQSLNQAVASLCVFAHKDVITAVRNRAIFRTARMNRVAERGHIVDGIMQDDNTSPRCAFVWCTGFKPHSDLQCCHLYAASKDADSYTDIRNIFFAPTFLAKLTDSQAKNLPELHALHLLRYRALNLYGYKGPQQTTCPAKPTDYDQLIWASPFGEGADAVVLESSLLARLAAQRNRITESVVHLGWTFSDYKPESRLKAKI